MEKRKIFLSKTGIASVAAILFGAGMLLTASSKIGMYPRVVFAAMIFLGAYALVEMRWKGCGAALERVSVKELLLILMLFINPLIGKMLGFYASGFLALLGISALIETPDSPKAWGKLVVYLLGVTAVVYVVFSVLLRIHTPKGIIL